MVIPAYPEVGAPAFTTPPGSLSLGQPFGGSPSGGATPGGSGGVLNQMTSQAWGSQAALDAQTLGITPASLAGTCVMESGCASDPASHGTISGTFQMADATYLQMMQEAEARDPSLAASIPPGLGGKNDPAVQAIAASQYMYDGATALQSAGIVSPTFTDTRAYFQFGPTSGTAVALANPSDLISLHLNLTSSQYAANGINPASTTVAQWRQSVADKVGSTATSNVLL